MGMWRRFLAAVFWVGLALHPATLQASTPDDPLRFFAHCTGRLSAELSHLWAISSPEAEQIETLRATTISILEAMTPEGQGRTVLSWRLNARAAHAALLSRASARGDAWARGRATAEIARCSTLVLGPATTAPPQAELLPTSTR